MSISYELAQELRDAGFPQHYQCDTCPRMDVCYPTLSELIEACGVTFSELEKISHTKEPQMWRACAYPCEECGVEQFVETFDPTPEEAVARLWLAFHKAPQP